MLDLYRMLPKESFELLFRNLSVRDYLKEIWSRYEQFGAIKEDYFEEIFNELFRFFLRPFELVLLNERAIRSMIPLNEMLEGRGVLNAYSELMNSLASHSLLTFKLLSDPFQQKTMLDDFIEEWRKIFRNFESKFEITLPDYPFLLPEGAKNYFLDCFLHWKGFVESYERYRRLLNETYLRAVKALIDFAERKGFKDFSEFRSFFQEVLSKEFDSLLKSEEYLELQGSLFSSLFDHIYCFRRFLELLMENNPASPFATVSQIDEAYKRILDLKRKVSELEKRIEMLEVELCSRKSEK